MKKASIDCIAQRRLEIFQTKMPCMTVYFYHATYALGVNLKSVIIGISRNSLLEAHKISVI